MISDLSFVIFFLTPALFCQLLTYFTLQPQSIWSFSGHRRKPSEPMTSAIVLDILYRISSRWVPWIWSFSVLGSRLSSSDLPLVWVLWILISSPVQPLSAHLPLAAGRRLTNRVLSELLLEHLPLTPFLLASLRDRPSPPGLSAYAVGNDRQPARRKSRPLASTRWGEGTQNGKRVRAKGQLSTGLF